MYESITGSISIFTTVKYFVDLDGGTYSTAINVERSEHVDFRDGPA